MVPSFVLWLLSGALGGGAAVFWWATPALARNHKIPPHVRDAIDRGEVLELTAVPREPIVPATAQTVDPAARQRELEATTPWEPYVQVNPRGRLYIGVWRKTEEYQFGVSLMYSDLDPDEDHTAKFDHATERALRLNQLSAR